MAELNCIAKIIKGSVNMSQEMKLSDRIDKEGSFIFP